MKLRDFKVEQWMNEYEMQAVYNLTDTCASNITLETLLSLETLDASSLIMDYGQITGDTELKNEILKLYKTGNINQITTAHGCIHANELVLNTVLEPGDHVIVCKPGYQQFVDIPLSLGCDVTEISLREENNWLFDLKELKQSIRENTKMIILNNPNNPTGTLLKDDILNQIIDLVKDKGIYILSDEVYRGYEKDVSSISDLYSLGISTSSLSKLYGLAALRMGWIKASEDIINQINVRRDYSLISTGPLLDKLSIIALKHTDYLVGLSRKNVQENKKIISDWIQENPKYSIVLPSSGTVSFLKYSMDIPSVEFCTRLLKDTGIFFVPGACFGVENHVRLGLAKECESMKKGLEILSNWTKSFDI